eukprot:184432-Pyramimonas_sp.AAC.1
MRRFAIQKGPVEHLRHRRHVRNLSHVLVASKKCRLLQNFQGSDDGSASLAGGTSARLSPWFRPSVAGPLTAPT